MHKLAPAAATFFAPGLSNCWGRFVYWLTMRMTALVGRVLFKLKVEGRENIPATGPLLIISNHLSHLDPPLVASVFPRPVFYMAKRELFSVPLLRSVLRCVRTIIVERGKARQSLDAALNYLRQGQPVVIFPEGTRSSNGRLGRGLGGAVSISLRSACTILPVAIIGSGEALHKGHRWLRAAPVQVRIGAPFCIPFRGDPRLAPRETMQAATRLMMERIEALLPSHMHATAEEKALWYGGS